MALFRMNVGGSGGGTVVDTYIQPFQCDSGYVGQTLTMHFIGTPHQGEVVNDISGVVANDGTLTLKPSHSGLWEYSCYSEITGEIYKDEVDYTYWGIYPTIELKDTPYGETVLPIDDIVTWIRCASVFDKKYSTISEVVNDASLLVTLLDNDNANKYLSRSTGFVALLQEQNFANQFALTKYNALFDEMASNATWYSAILSSPYFTTICPLLNNVAHTSETSTVGKATESGSLQGFSFWKSCRLKKDSSGDRAIWYGAKGQYGKYTFNSKCKVVRILYQNSYDANSGYYGNMDIYNDDKNVKIASVTGAAGGSKEYTVNIASANLAYNSAYRFVSTSANMGFSYLRMYGRREA